MKYLALALLLCALTSLSDASCYRTKMKPGITHCQDEEDDTWHAVGSEWRNSKCMRCTCHACCDVAPYPGGFPDDCVAVLDLKACNYTVHKKNDTTVLCPVSFYDL